jgi:hypothetical protein
MRSHSTGPTGTLTPKRGILRWYEWCITGGRVPPFVGPEDGIGNLKAAGAMNCADRRYTYRLDLPEDRVRLYAPRVGRVVVADLSASGTGLIVSPDDFGQVSADPATFEFSTGQSFSVKLDPVRVANVDRQLRVGARFQGLPVEGMRVLSQFLVSEFLEENNTLGRLLEDPRTLTTRSATFIRRHLRRCLFAEGRPLRVYSQGKLLPTSILAVRMLNEGGRSVIEARVTDTGLEDGKSYMFLVTQPGAVTHFTARVERRFDTTLVICLPEAMYQAGFRNSIRTDVQATGRATVVCEHPRLCDALITRPLLDLSARGFAFECDPESDLLFPGDWLERIQIRFEDKVYRAAGRIRGIAPHGGSSSYSCGVEIVGFADAAEEHHFRERVFRLEHPRVSLPEPSRGAGCAWRVLEASGYVSLWTPEQDGVGLSSKFSRFWNDARPEVARLLLLETDGEAVATMACSLLFPRTWMLHNFGVDKMQRANPATFLRHARETYAAATYVLQHVAPLDYVVIYVENGKRFTQALYADFVERYAPAEDSRYDELRVFKCSPGERRIERKRRINPTEVALADPVALKAVSQHLRAALPPLEFDAFGYDEANIDFAAFAEECRKWNYDRARHVFLAWEQGVPMAALIAESGEEGVNLFGLMNRCHLIALGTAGVSVAAREALLSTAQRHYSELGKHAFVFLGDRDEDVRELEDLGYEFVSEGVRWLARRSALPAWLSLVENSLAS